MTWTRSRKWKVAAVAAVLAVAATALLGRRMVAERLLEALQSGASRRYGLEVRVDRVSLSLLRGTAVFEGLRILEGPATILEAERVEVDGRVLDVLHGRIDCTKLAVLRPVLRIVVEEDGRTNLQRIRGWSPEVAAAGPAEVVILREGTIEGGRLEILDATTDPDRPLRLVVEGLRGSMREWQFAGESASTSSADLRVDGEIEQGDVPARISVVAWCSPAGGPSAGTLLAAVTGFDLRRVPSYVGAVDRVALGGHFLDVAVDVRSRGGVIGPGAVRGEVAGSGTVLTMRVGGTTGDPVFDEDSPLATLFRLPLGRIFRLGSVTLDAGWSAIRGGGHAVADVAGGVAGAGASLGTGLGNAGGELLEGDPLGALAEAGGGVVGVVTSIGGGLLDGAASLLGGGAGTVHAVVGENPAELRLRFKERHAARRLSMLRAALASAVGEAARERHARIAGEIETSTPRSDGTQPGTGVPLPKRGDRGGNRSPPRGPAPRR